MKEALVFIWDREDNYNDGVGGGYGYRNRLERFGGGIKVYFNDRRNPQDPQGIHIEISGVGFGYLLRPLDSLMWGIIKTQCNVTRLDIATDDFFGFTNLDTIEHYTREKYLTSRFKMSRIVVEVPLIQGVDEELGKTIYFGNPAKSDIYFRFYDKRKERIKKKGFCDYPHWNRLEITFKRKHALMIAVILGSADCKNISDVVFSIFKKYLTFREPNENNKTVRNWEVALWWEQFINSRLEFNFTKKNDVSVDSTYDWISHQVSKSLFLLFKAFGEDYNLLQKFLIDGEKKMKESDLKKVKLFKQKYGNIDFLSYLEIQERLSNYEKSEQ